MEIIITTLAGWTLLIDNCRPVTGAGSTPGTIAENGAWILSPLRHLRSMIGSKDSWIVRIWNVITLNGSYVFYSFSANVAYFWTSGRLCDFDGCDRPDLFPKNINGWFWSANQVAMSPTNSTHRFHDWSHTGGAGIQQPDNREEVQLHGSTESCMAVLNNYYGDGK